MEISNRYPVTVVGGGPGGIMAALASARNGAKTLLVEQGAFLGGTATRSVIGPISPFHYGDEQIIAGLAQEFIDRMVAHGGATGHLKCINPTGTGSYICLYDHEAYKYVAQEMLLEAGVDLLFHCRIGRVLKEGNRVSGLVLDSRLGTMAVASQIVIDATGDGDVAVLSGEAYTVGNAEKKSQPSSMMFEMAGVDVERLYDYVLGNQEEFTRRSELLALKGENNLRNPPYFVAQGYLSLVRKAVEDGELVFGRDCVHTITGFNPGWMHFNTARLTGYDSLDIVDRTKAEIDGRRQMESIVSFMKKRVPGYGNAYLARAGGEVGVRETRHIEGVYKLTKDDVASGRKFPDAISRGGFAIDIHGGKSDPSMKGTGGYWKDLEDCYDIPYRCLVPAHVDGLLLAGRSISGASEAHASFRTQGVVMGYSQAAGVAAAHCALRGLQPRQADVAQIRQALTAMGASPLRNEADKQRNEQRAKAVVTAFVSAHPRHITPDEYLR